MKIADLLESKKIKQRLDPKCWTGWHKSGTKIKGGVRVNNCVKNESNDRLREIEIVQPQSFDKSYIKSLFSHSSPLNADILGFPLYKIDYENQRIIMVWDDKNQQPAAFVGFEHQPHIRDSLWMSKNAESFVPNMALYAKIIQYCKQTMGMSIQSDMTQSKKAQDMWIKTLPSLGLTPQVYDTETHRVLSADKVDPCGDNNHRYCWILEHNDVYRNKLLENSLIQPFNNYYLNNQNGLTEFRNLMRFGLDATKIKDSVKNESSDKSNREIRNYKKLDKILEKLCDLVDRGRKKDSEKYGLVGAAVLDLENRTATGVSLKKDGKWHHAERSAMDTYRKKYGDIPDGCIMITTCSPCSERMDDRYGESCTDIINDSAIKKVYSGFDDFTQPESNRSFNIITTADEDIRDRCGFYAKKFMKHEMNQHIGNDSDKK